MSLKLSRIISSFSRHNIDAFLVTKGINIDYLVGFPSKDSWLLVTPRKTFYITDARYSLEVRQHLKGVSVCEHKKSLPDQVACLVQKNRLKRIGLDARYISLAEFKQIQRNLQSAKLVIVNSLVEPLREIKDSKEISLIQKAVKINLGCFRYLSGILRPGFTERQVLSQLEGYLKRQGARFSFPPIIASGPHASYPHAQVSDRILRRGESVIADIGIDVQGYKSDLTRVFFLGKIPQLVREVYGVICEAQQVAISQIRPGKRAKEIDQSVRNFLKQKKLEKFFIHSLGHGIGLEVHEAPALSERSSAVLKKGMIFTIEPGVYFPHQLGIRVEDMVLVTDDGCKILSSDF